MSAIGKLAASILSGSQETTLALAQVNFDFSLYKVEAPMEFRELGAALSTQRRAKAERGSQHITARKLGALFGQLLPPTPSLIKAYGIRVSEIAKSSNVNQTASKSDGIFADHVGIDGTSIWAAATSGEEAMAVHLLACMLARVWSPAEATSIWAQIVEERKRELRTTGDPLHLSALAAMEVTITSEQLADWDASARAWLATADREMQKQQKQLMLILGNVNLPVNSKMNVFESVLQAWKSAISMVDNLIGGMGQRVHDGAVLLGLSAWHLYPSLHVLGETSTEVRFKDKLLGEGGVLTIGLQNFSPNNEDGLAWSLPLSFLRYYGSPVVSTKALGSQTSRVSMKQLTHVALGGVIRDCRLAGIDSLEVARFIKCLASCVAKAGTLPSWLALLESTASALLASEGSVQESLKRLVSLGSRRCTKFLTSDAQLGNESFFGFCEPTSFLRLLNNPEDQVAFLRNFARRLHLRPGTCIIHLKDSRGIESFATAVPCSLDVKYHPSNKPAGSFQHFRWYEMSGSEEADQKKVAYQGTDDTKILVQKGLMTFTTLKHHFNWRDAPICFPRNSTRKASQGNAPRGFRPYLQLSRSFGSDDTATLYRLYGSHLSDDQVIKETNKLKTVDIIQAFEEDKVSGRKLLELFEGSSYFETELFQSLGVLSEVASIYKDLEGATVSLDITSQPLSRMTWVRASTTNKNQRSRGEIFACIASFESGSPHFSQYELGNVMAMSTGDSIYVSAALLQDPIHFTKPHQVLRINGNVGKSGIAMMIPPSQPLVRELDNDTWNLVNHEQFDGTSQNAFGSTSLHLTFSDYTLPINLSAHGNRYREAFFLESLISVYDRGSWVADLDVLSALEDSLFSRVSYASSECRHSSKSKQMKKEKRAFELAHLTSIDSWTELLDRPEGFGIVRSHKNWLGRLATAVLSVQKGYDTRVLPEEFCWGCLLDNKVLEVSERTRAGRMSKDLEDEKYDDSEVSEEEPSTSTKPNPILIC